VAKPAEPASRGDRDVAPIAALFGDPARAAMLAALTAGHALPAGELARAAGVHPATATAHLRRLIDAGLVRVRAQGRHRYHELAGPEVAAVLEALAQLSPPVPIRSAVRSGQSLRAPTRCSAVRCRPGARSCASEFCPASKTTVMSAACQAGRPRRRPPGTGCLQLADHGGELGDVGPVAGVGVPGQRDPAVPGDDQAQTDQPQVRAFLLGLAPLRDRRLAVPGVDERGEVRHVQRHRRAVHPGCLHDPHRDPAGDLLQLLQA
jgi:DNA-binding transcriptional ArsR family regulator